MTRCTWWLCVLIVLAIAAAPILGAADAPKPKDTPKADQPKPTDKPKPASTELKGEYAIMAAELKLTDEQKAKLDGIIKTHKAALEAWMKDKGPKLKELQKSLGELRKAGKKDDPKVKELQDQIKPLTDEQAKMREAQQTEVMSILTDEQKAAWKVFKLYTGQCNRYRKAELTDDQKTKVKELCAAAVKDMGDGKDRKAVAEADKKLQAGILALLSADQKAKMEKKPDAKPAAKAETKPPEGK